MRSPGAVQDAWLITGIPGAGKTTVARALARRFPRAAHVEGDRLQEWIVAGAVPPGEAPREESDRQIDLCIANQCVLARSYAAAGFVPVLDYVVVTRANLDRYRARLPGLALHLAVLDPGVSVALARDRARPDKTVAHRWAHLEPLLRAELRGLGLWLDTAALAPAESVDAILAGGDRAFLS